MNETFDVIVIGAGAAGLMAAIRAAELGRRVLLLEKNRKPGVKILMSGGTRCNVTHACDERGIVEAYGPPGKFLFSALAAFSVQGTLDFFEAEGVPTKIEPNGKIFPVSNKALDVLNALLARLQRSPATLALEEPVIDVKRTEQGFDVSTPRRTVSTKSVIVTTGGKSYPGSGTTGDGYRWLAAFGHTIVPPRPALTPIKSSAPWIAELRGVTLPDVTLTLGGVTAKPVTRRGSLLFAHFGLTGPVALDLSRLISGHPKPAELSLAIDLSSDNSAEEIDRWLQQQSLAEGKKQLATILTERLPHRIAELLLSQTAQAIDRKAAGLSKVDRAALVQLMKRLPVPATGTLGFEKAEVTAGGVALNEVDSRDMQSRLVPGLFIAGELLDLDGPIGGYNFQAAWSTGWLAGQNADKN
ncbi:MAG: NAD(P)/FAD-dependent oxidoreductase [Gemmataceae bacterium]